MNGSDFGVCDLISKVTKVTKVRYVVSGSWGIFIMDRYIDFKFNMGTQHDQLYPSIEAAKLDI